MARKFFYVCAGLFLLAAGYGFGARNVGAGALLQTGSASAAACGVAGRFVFAMPRDGGAVISWPQPLPGSASAVGVFCNEEGYACVIMDDGDVFHAFTTDAWQLSGNLFSGPTPVQGETLGQFKVRYRSR